jgi:tetratricopeptide (TPR) repeat protein
MAAEPHLIFAEASLDIARGECRAALDKLAKLGDGFPESYALHLLKARALRGAGRVAEAVGHLKQCCRLAPSNQVAWPELVEATILASSMPEQAAPVFDPVADELEQLSIALSGFQPPRAPETADPTPIAEQQQPFADDEVIPVPTESLARLFIDQGAYKKAIRVYTALIQLKPRMADDYRRSIDRLLDRL